MSRTSSTRLSLLEDRKLIDMMLRAGGRYDEDGNVLLSKCSLLARLKRAGVLSGDPRLKQFFKTLDEIDEELTYTDFQEAALHNVTFLKRIAYRELAIADFANFNNKVEYLFESVRSDNSGQNAQYIPTLATVDPLQFGVAFCSTDGQFLEHGDSRAPFSVQSCSKPVMLALALEKLGLKEFNKWVGVAPSGQSFNHASLLPDGRPFNPMINAGAIMSAGLVASAYPDKCKIANVPIGPHNVHAENLLEEVLKPIWKKLSGEGVVGDIGFDEETFMCERATGDNNYALAYTMRGRTGLRQPVTLETMLDFYFRSCSLQATAATMAIIAATLANGGLCPMTGRQVLSSENVRHVLSSMVSSGLYGFAGDIYIKIGCPAKSGVSGCIMVVIPSLGGYCVFSPRLDSFGNSVRGVAFCEALHAAFRFHAFDTVGSWVSKEDPRYSSNDKHIREIEDLRWALSIGDRKANVFADLLKRTAIYVGWADGRFSQGDYKVLTDAYFQVTRTSVSEKEICLLIDEIGATIESGSPTSELDTSHDRLQDVLLLLEEKSTMLSDTEKELILEISLLITYPNFQDCDLNHNDRIILHDICEALGVPVGIIPLKMYDLSKNKGRKFSFISVADTEK